MTAMTTAWGAACCVAANPMGYSQAKLNRDQQVQPLARKNVAFDTGFLLEIEGGMIC